MEEYLRRLQEQGVGDREIERMKGAPVFGKAALQQIEEAVGWLKEGIALFEDPPEEHLPNGSDVDEMKDTVSGYLDEAKRILSSERADAEETIKALIHVDLDLPKPGFLGEEVSPYEAEVEICTFFMTAVMEQAYWRVTFPSWKARLDALQEVGDCRWCLAWLTVLLKVNLENSHVLEDEHGGYKLDANVIEMVVRGNEETYPSVIVWHSA